MARGLSFLQRFRHVVTPPGRPSQAVGVPESGDALEGELGPVLDQLEPVADQAAAIEAEAREEARRLREDAAREAASIVADARARADGERAQASSQRRASAQHRVAEARTAAEREAERIGSIREERVEELVSEVLECVWRSGA